MATPESKAAFSSNRLVKTGFGIFLFAVFGAIGVGALMERRWEAAPLGLIFSVLSLYSLFRAVIAFRASPFQQGE
jgi:hypothetical protein